MTATNLLFRKPPLPDPGIVSNTTLYTSPIEYFCVGGPQDHAIIPQGTQHLVAFIVMIYGGKRRQGKIRKGKGPWYKV